MGILLFVLLSLFSCKFPGTGEPVDLTISILLPEEQRTIMPGISLTINEYCIEGAGPAGAGYSKTTAEKSFSERFTQGSWVFTVTGLNSEGIVVAGGQGSLFLYPGETRNLEILLLPLAGSGSLSLSVIWPPGLPEGSCLSGSLTPLFGQEEPRMFEIPVAQAEHLFSEVPAGYHTLQAVLGFEGSVYAGLTEVVRIIAGCETLAVMSFSPDPAVLVFTFAENLLEPLNIPIVPENPAGIRGFPLILSAGNTPGSGPTHTWYLNGLYAGQGDTLLLSTGSLGGGGRIDLVSVLASGLRAGSASAGLSLSEPVRLGPWAVHSRHQDNQGGCDGLRGARTCLWDPLGEFLAVSGYDDNKVALFAPRFCSADPPGGDIIIGLSALDPIISAGSYSLNGPWAITITPGGERLFCASYKSDRVDIYNILRDPLGFSYSCSLTEGEGSWIDPLGLPVLAGAAGLAVSPGGEYLYVSASGADCLSWFSLETGTPLFAGAYRGEGPAPGTFAGPRSLAVSPCGGYLYLASYTGDSLHCFELNQETGEPVYLKSFTDSIAGTDGLNGPEEIALCPEGRSVYIASYYDHCISHIRWDPDFQSLEYAGLYKEGENGISGLSYARSIAVSPDGDYAAAASSGSDAVNLFLRDPETGALNWAGAAAKGQEGIAGLDNPRCVAFAPRSWPTAEDFTETLYPPLAASASSSHELYLFLTYPSWE